MNLKNPLALLVSWITLALAPAQAVHAAETGASSQPAVAQGTVTGIVTNAATGRALEGARVVLQGTGRATSAFPFADRVRAMASAFATFRFMKTVFR